MKRWLKRLGIGLASLIGLILVLVLAANAVSLVRQQKVYQVAVRPLPSPTDSAAIDRGRHLTTAVGACGSCHGPDLGGQVLADNPVLGRLTARNLTSGQGGIGKDYGDDDFDRAIRHGVGRNGKSLVFMPSESYQAFSDADLAHLILYLRSLPPVNRDNPEIRVGVLARVFHLFGFPLLSAEHVDHGASRAAPEPRATVEYGQYMASASGCRGCHGPALAGGAGPGPNITPGAIGSWTEADFFRTMREGKRPDGRMLSDEMPWKSYRQMTDLELQALWQYLRSVPPKAPKKS